MNTLSKYSLINAKLRAAVSKLFKKEILDKLITCGTLLECHDILQNTPYQKIFNAVPQPYDINLLEYHLFKEEINIYSEITKHVYGETKKTILRLMEKLELENLKSTFRIWLGKASSNYLVHERIVSPIPTAKILQAEDLKTVVSYLKGTPYYSSFQEILPAILEESVLFQLETKLDINYYKRLWNQISELSARDRLLSYQLLGIDIDIKNIQIIHRLKKYYQLSSAEIFKHLIPLQGGVREALKEIIYADYKIQKNFGFLNDKSLLPLEALLSEKNAQDKLFFLEEILNEVLISKAKKALLGFPFSIGIILAFLTLKKIEIENIKKILRGKALNIPPQEIKKKILTI